MHIYLRLLEDYDGKVDESIGYFDVVIRRHVCMTAALPNEPRPRAVYNTACKN